MILHNVYFWLKKEVSESQKHDFEQGILDFLSNVPEVQKYTIGKPAETPSREVVDHTYDFSIFVWFASIEDHNIYQAHPVHDVFVDKFNDLWEKVQVFDSYTRT